MAVQKRSENQYYIVSNEHTHGEIIRCFWKPNDCGYTFNLDEAGLYPIKHNGFRRITKKNAHLRGRYSDFLIHPKDLELIGPIIRAVGN